MIYILINELKKAINKKRLLLIIPVFVLFVLLNANSYFNSFESKTFADFANNEPALYNKYLTKLTVAKETRDFCLSSLRTMNDLMNDNSSESYMEHLALFTEADNASDEFASIETLYNAGDYIGANKIFLKEYRATLPKEPMRRFDNLVYNLDGCYDKELLNYLIDNNINEFVWDVGNNYSNTLGYITNLFQKNPIFILILIISIFVSYDFINDERENDNFKSIMLEPYPLLTTYIVKIIINILIIVISVFASFGISYIILNLCHEAGELSQYVKISSSVFDLSRTIIDYSKTDIITTASFYKEIVINILFTATFITLVFALTSCFVKKSFVNLGIVGTAILIIYLLISSRIIPQFVCKTPFIYLGRAFYLFRLKYTSGVIFKFYYRTNLLNYYLSTGISIGLLITLLIIFVRRKDSLL